LRLSWNIVERAFIFYWLKKSIYYIDYMNMKTYSIWQKNKKLKTYYFLSIYLGELNIFFLLSSYYIINLLFKKEHLLYWLSKIENNLYMDKNLKLRESSILRFLVSYYINAALDMSFSQNPHKIYIRVQHL